MMYTVDAMLRTLRSKLQEQNNSKVTDQMLLDFLNQGQDFCFDIVARRYPDSIAATAKAVINEDGITFNMPENAFEQRLTRVYRSDKNYTTPLERVNYREKDDYEGKIGVPTNYAILKNKVYLLPADSINDFEWLYSYVEDVEPFVVQQGQIREITRVGDLVDAVPATNASVVVDAIGSGLSIDSDSMDRFVNIIDAQSGLIKGSLEIKDLDSTTNKITFKNTPTRTKVNNKIIESALDLAVEEDDYICSIFGSCVPYFRKPAYNYILQFATTELKRSLGMDAQMEDIALRKYEEQMEKLNSARESSTRVYRTKYQRVDRRW